MDPRRLVDLLTQWARATPWVESLELAGSLGRDAGDRWSDVDAGAGLADGEDVWARLDDVEVAVASFGTVAGASREPMGDGCHVATVFADGSELSLVVAPASARSGLPPEAKALVDKAGRLSVALPASRWEPSEATLQLWRQHAWSICADAARHAVRGESWRALESLGIARGHLWRWWAAVHGVVFPQFGVVSVVNAGVPVPDGIEATHPSSLTSVELVRAVRALLAVLRRELGDSPVADAIEHRVAEIAAAAEKAS